MTRKIQGTRKEHKIHNVKLKCPDCKGNNVFTVFGVVLQNNGLQYGQAICPNDTCCAHVFFIRSLNPVKIENVYPVTLDDFDNTNVPDKLSELFNEALICKANQCFVAAAIMIRRTLEELCSIQGAEGKNLKEKIEDLREKVTLPPALLNGMQKLRLLGNDAAHIEAKTYGAISQNELDISIAITKEIIKSLYQLDTLIAQLENLEIKDND